MKLSEMEPEYRAAVISFEAVGLDAENCLHQVMADIHGFTRDQSAHLPFRIERFLDPGADFAFLLLSGPAGVTEEILLGLCERWQDDSASRGCRQVRLAITLDGACLDDGALERLLASDFSVIDARENGDPQLAARAAVTGLIGTMWTKSPVCTDFEDVLTALTRRGGMRGNLNFLSLAEFEAKALFSVPNFGSAHEGGLFAVVISDSSFRQDQLEMACDVAADRIPDSWDGKVSMVFVSPYCTLLRGDSVQISRILVSR